MRPIIKSATSVLTVFSMALGIVLLIPNASAAAENGNWKADGSTKTSTGQKTPIEFIYKGSSSEAPSQTQARVNWGDETESGEDQEDNNTVSANSCTTTLGSKKFICEASGSHIYYQPGTYIGTLTPLAYNDETETNQPAGPPTTFKVIVTGNPIPRPYWLSFPDVTSTLSPIPDMVTAPTEFSVSSTRIDGVQACSATFEGVKKDGAGPWTFTYNPTVIGRSTRGRWGGTGLVFLVFCDGGEAVVQFDPRPLFSLGGPRLISVTKEDKRRKANSQWIISNNAVTEATAELLQGSKILDSIVIAANDRGEFTRLFKAKQFKTGNTAFTVRVKDTTGASMNFPITVAKGWAGLSDFVNPTFEPCSTVTWSYNKNSQPNSSKLMYRTISQSMTLLSKKTGLRIVEAPKGVAGDIRVGWGNLSAMGYGNVAGVGGPGGDITLNTKKNVSVRDSYAGFEQREQGRQYGGNGWLIAHEALHVLGMGHSDSNGELMSSSNADQAKDGFGKGDMAGIKELYRPGTCG
jgi:hypothetical protein